MRTFTMVAKHGVSKDSITGFTLISSDYQTVTVSLNELAKMVSQKKIVVNNLAFDKGSWNTTNGAKDNYMLVNSNTNMIEGPSKAVILDRIEQNGKLVGYTAFTQQGTVATISVADAVTLAKNKMLSNGKIRHTDGGDIVSAIGGNFNLRETKIENAPKGETSVEIMFFGEALVSGGFVGYFGAFVGCTSATEITRLKETLSHSNAAVIGAVVKDAGQNARKSMAIRRFGASSLYGVFKLDDIKTLKASGAKVKLKDDAALVSVMKYKKDGSAEAEDEAVIKLLGGKGYRVFNVEAAEDSKLNEEIKKLEQRVVDLLGV